MLNKTPARGQGERRLRPGPGLGAQSQRRRVKEPRPRAGPAGLAAYLRWAPRSSSPLPRHRRPPASPCSGIRSGERGGKRPQRGSAAHPSPPASSGRPYLIDTPEEGEELAEQGGTHARDMNERALGDGSGRE